MALKAYPLNDTNYTAEDAQLYTATRTSGVYADNHFNISVTGADNNVTIKPGMGWMKLAMFQGIAVANDEDFTINAGVPDSVLPRIDAVVYAYDANANKPEIIIKQGEKGTTPTPPAVVRDDFRHELHLYHIRRRPGATAITPGDITDLRMDANYCGLMADSVTQVDMSAINAQIKDFITDWESQIANVTDGKMVESPEYPGCYYRLNGGVVEWLNPPMMVGKEYRLSQRDDGKRVYTKMVKFESIKEYSELAVSGVEKIVSISAVIERLLTDSSGRTFFEVPCSDVPPETDRVAALNRTQVYFYDGKICVDFAMRRGRYDLYVTINYTRSDDVEYTSAYADGDSLYIDTSGATTQSGSTVTTELYATVDSGGGEYVNSFVINGNRYNLAINLADSGEPSSSLPGNVGQIYTDLYTKKTYVCISANSTSGDYKWVPVVSDPFYTSELRLKHGAGIRFSKIVADENKIEIKNPISDTIVRGVATPTSDNDAANKAYVDSKVGSGSGQNVDLTGYAKEEWVQNNYQPKGDYLTSAPVTSVNGRTGKVLLRAPDVGAMPAETEIPGKTSELTNDSGFIDKAVSDLKNYYTKAQTQELIAQISTFQVLVVQQLPTTGAEKTLYLVPFASDGGNYAEYLWANGAWELLGTPHVDLTGYATEEWVQEMLAGKTGAYLPMPKAYNAGEWVFVEEVDGKGNVSKTGTKVLDWVATHTSRVDPSDQVLVPEVTLQTGITNAFGYDTLAGQTEVLVVCDGKLHLCNVEFDYSEGDGYFYHLGNKSLLFQATDTGEPFFFHGYKGTGTMAHFSTTGEHTVEIYGGEEVLIYNKMPEEYLPDGVVKTVNGVAPDENGNVNVDGAGPGQNLNPVAKTEDMTQPVGVDADGKLWTVPGGGSGLGLLDIEPGEEFTLAAAGGSATYGEIVLSTAAETVDEGGMVTFTVKLATAPAGTQTVSLSASNADVTLDKAKLTFTSDNYATEQTVKATVAVDEDASHDSCTITARSYGVASKEILLTISDLDEDTTPASTHYTYVFDINAATNANKTLTMVANPNGDGQTDWGDGTVDNELTHTYADYGVYTVVTDNTMEAGQGKATRLSLKRVESMSLALSVSGEGVAAANNTFSYCENLEYTCDIPAGYKRLYETFLFCKKLANAPKIPAGCEMLYGTFWNCGFTAPPAIPTSVTNLQNAFRGAKITVAPQLHSGVTNCMSMCEACNSLTDTLEPWNIEFTAMESNGSGGCFARCALIDLSTVPTTWGGTMEVA